VVAATEEFAGRKQALGGRAVNGRYFAGRLKELREAAGLSQKALAERAGVSQQGIAHWEQGERDPSWPAVIALAAALGVSVEAFLEKPGEAPPRGRGRPPKGDKGRGNK